MAPAWRATQRRIRVVRLALPVFVLGGQSPTYTARPAHQALAAQQLASSDSIVLTRIGDKGTIRLVVRRSWGGSIVGLAINGLDVVNSYDPGRNLQPALYDGAATYDSCSGCTLKWGWNPVLAGDRYGHSSELLSESIGPGRIYTKSQPLQWVPESAGGGPTRGVPSDVIIEQWIESSPLDSGLFELHWRINHTGGDSHALADQELPAVFANERFNRLVTSGAATPWSGSKPAIMTLGVSSQRVKAVSRERWAALIDDDSVGIGVLLPWAYSDVSARSIPAVEGRNGWAANYFKFRAPRAIGPRETWDATAFVMVGHLAQIRNVFSRAATSDSIDPLAPVGALDSPVASGSYKRAVAVTGWAADNDRVAGVEVFVDGRKVGDAHYNLIRADVARTYPAFGSFTGFKLLLDLASFGEGPHVISVIVHDSHGNRRNVGTRTFTVLK